MEGYRRKPIRDTVHREACGVQDKKLKENIETRERLALRHKLKEEEHFEIFGGLREEIGMKTCLLGPRDYAKTLKLRFRGAGLDRPEKIKRSASSREEEDELPQMCPCGRYVERRTHIWEECEIYKEKRDVSEEMRKNDECGMDKIGKL